MQPSLPEFPSFDSSRRKSSSETPDSERWKYVDLFRVTQIPLDWEKDTLLSFLVEHGKIMDPLIKSLAQDIDARYKTATITCTTSRIEREWCIKIADSVSNSGSLMLDTDFHGLTTLYAPPVSHEIDIVAIPGIGGHAFGSFRARKSDHMWLRDSLPTDLTPNNATQPIARISIYGYESPIPDGNNIQDLLEELARGLHFHLVQLANAPMIKPIILIAHSLGGLVVRKVLTRISESRENDDNKLLQAISRIVSFGVPYTDMDIEWLLPMASDGPNRPLIESTHHSSSILGVEQHRFKKCLRDHDIKVFCFYETFPSPATPTKNEYGRWTFGDPKRILVNQFSATACGTGPDHQCAIARTHSEMVKFGPNDYTYDIVRDRLLALVRNIVRPHPPQDALELKPSPAVRQQLIKLLHFDQIDTRIKAVRKPAKNTCSWIRDTAMYKSLRDTGQWTEHHGFWCIQGKPGVGKSVLMKYLCCDSMKTIQGAEIIHFFFNAQGDILERSTVGLYRSLLSQIFKLIPDLHSTLDTLGPYHTWKIEQEGWQIETLQYALLQSVKRLGSHQLVCYVDALDECLEHEVDEMVRFFERAREKAIYHQTSLSICFSSRKFPLIPIKGGLIMQLEHQEDHEADIKHYIDTELRINELKYAEEAKKGIMEKASGVFLWVTLVIPMLQKAFDHDNIRAFTQRLQELPVSLSGLFLDILERDNDNKDALLCCIQWILFSKSQLDLITLYSAINTATEYGWNQEDVTDEIMHQYIISVSKGFVQPTVSKVPKMQFIHKSVCDFFLKERGFQKLWPELSPNFEAKGFQSLAYCCRKQITAASLNKREIPSPLPPAKLRSEFTSAFPFLEHAVDNILHYSNLAHKYGEPQSKFIEEFPKAQWISYYNLLERHPTRHYPENISLLYILAERDLVQLVRLLPDRVRHLQLEEGRYRNPLLAALARGSKNVARDLGLQVFLDQRVLKVSGRRFDVYFDNLKAKLNFSPQKKEIEVCLVEFDCVPTVMALISQDIEPGDRYYSGRTLLSWAVVFRAQEMIKMLLKEVRTNIEAVDKYGQTPLLSAASQGYTEIVKLLVNHGANIEAVDKYGQTPLLSAASQGYTETVKLLVNSGANIEAVDKYGQTPLLSAASRGYFTERSQYLFNRLDLIKTDDEDNQTLMLLAAFKGITETVKLLVNHGANIEAVDKDGQTPLVLASEASTASAVSSPAFIPVAIAAAAAAAEIVRLLVDKGANIEAIDRNGQTPLVLVLAALTASVESPPAYIPVETTEAAAAAATAAEEIARLLVDKGANIEAADRNGQTPLLLVSAALTASIVSPPAFRPVETAEAAVAAAAAVLAATAVATAAAAEIVRLLVDKGANIEAVDRNGQTPLVLVLAALTASVESPPAYLTVERRAAAAAAAAAAEIVRLLVDKGANIEAVDRNGQTPLVLASAALERAAASLALSLNPEVAAAAAVAAAATAAEMVRFLVDKGANIEAIDKDGRTLRVLASVALKAVERFGDYSLEAAAAAVEGERCILKLLPSDIPHEVEEQDFRKNGSDNSTSASKNNEPPRIAADTKIIMESKSFGYLLSDLLQVLLPTELRQVLQSIPKQNIRLSANDAVSYVDSVKIWVQTKTQLKWNWWPLEEPKRVLQPHESRMWWKCTCGARQWREISDEQRITVKQILQLLQDKPRSQYWCVTKLKRPSIVARARGIFQTSAPSGHSRAAQRYVPSADNSRLSGSALTGSSSLETGGWANSGSAMGSGPNPTQISYPRAGGRDSSNPTNKYILFGVQGPGRTMIPGEVYVSDQSNDFSVFQDLKRCYESRRGFWRLHCSIWRLEYCDVTKFNRLALNRMVHDYRELPDHDSYDYYPRVGSAGAKNPPLSAHMFQAIYYACKPMCDRISFLHDCMLAPSGRTGINRIPKRKDSFERDQTREIWGLEAIFEVSFAYVVLYHCLLVIGPFVFWGWWIGKYPGDWQNASVPLTAVLGGLSLFWSSSGILTAKVRR